MSTPSVVVESKIFTGPGTSGKNKDAELRQMICGMDQDTFCRSVFQKVIDILPEEIQKSMFYNMHSFMINSVRLFDEESKEKSILIVKDAISDNLIVKFLAIANTFMEEIRKTNNIENDNKEKCKDLTLVISLMKKLGKETKELETELNELSSFDTNKIIEDAIKKIIFQYVPSLITIIQNQNSNVEKIEIYGTFLKQVCSIINNLRGLFTDNLKGIQNQMNEIFHNYIRNIIENDYPVFKKLGDINMFICLDEEWVICSNCGDPIPQSIECICLDISKMENK